MRSIVLAAALTAAVGTRAAAQDLPCPEFPVNEYTTSDQAAPRVASAPNGDFVVVWTSFRDPTDSEIIGRRYDASAQPRGPAFLVNTYTTGHQSNPDVAIDGSGNFVVVWSGQGDGDPTGIFAQRYDGSGTPQGGELRVNPVTDFTQHSPAVAADPAGNFVVAWARYTYDGGPRGIFGQRFDAGGIPQGTQFPVNTISNGDDFAPAVSRDPTGAFVIAWHRNFFGSPFGVNGRRYAPDGAALGDQFRIDSATDDGFDPSLTHDPNGGFLVVWATHPEGVIVGRRFDSSGAAQGGSFPISGASGGAERPVIARDAQDYVVAWSRRVSGIDFDVLGHRLVPTGVPLGSDFRLNSYTTSAQSAVSLARTPNGGFVAVWSSAGQDGDGWGVFGSLDCARFYTVNPCRVADTRDPPGTPLAANTSRVFPLTASCGIPADARAVAVNATAVNPTDFGDLRLYPAGAAAPLASALNFAAGVTRANNAIVPLGSGGGLAVQCDMPMGSAGSTHVVLDAYGYFKR